MKIERINENQIRCTLTSADLSMRNLNLGELAYGSEKARNLFREMIQKASNEVGFEAEDIPLMVEAIPLSNESVMLVITKIEDPEELDTRFSKFSPFTDEDSNGLFGELASELLEGADALLDFLKKDIAELPDKNSLNESEAAEAPETAEPKIQTRICRFSSLDAVIEAAKVTSNICNAANTLYKKPDASQYYLVLSSADTDPQAFSRLCNVLTEYSEKVKTEAASEAYYHEHYEIISHDHALQKLALV